METICLKNSDLKVSRLCFGGCPMGGHGWGRVSGQELAAAVRSAVDLGVNFFDTADVYGLGQSETLLGQALGSRRQDVVISTKFGVRVENGRTFYDNSRDWINRAVAASLKRLGTDYIDVYQVHYRDSAVPVGYVVDSLERLREKGLIRAYGLSNIHCGDLDELQEHRGKFTCFQDEYSLACRKNETDFLELPDKLALTPLTWGSLGQGVLTGKYSGSSVFETDDRRSRRDYVNFHGEKLQKNLEIVREINKIAQQVQKPPSAVAIRWILDRIPGSVAIVGAKNAAQVGGNCAAAGWSLTQEQLDQLDQISKQGSNVLQAAAVLTGEYNDK